MCTNIANHVHWEVVELSHTVGLKAGIVEVLLTMQSVFDSLSLLQGLTKLLADNAPKCMREQKFENYFGRKIAIDASMSIYSFLVSSCCKAAANATFYQSVACSISLQCPTNAGKRIQLLPAQAIKGIQI
jgi:hypothetical protein